MPFMVIVEIITEGDPAEVWAQLKEDAGRDPGHRLSGTGMTLETSSLVVSVRPVTVG